LAIDHATIALRDGAGTQARQVLARALTAAGKKADAIKQYRLLLKEEPKNRAAQQELDALTKPPPRKKKHR
ncbi:MAG TPA: tetratricopeptide repeat protein, partial [Kofleriaceae bacterium]|nr:tetratricopeptide repeat protein [Kofleriaceae bacterium]